MSNLTLHFDKKASESINNLKNYYGVSSQADIISKALALLKVAAEVDGTHGELLARKGDRETRIIIK